MGRVDGWSLEKLFKSFGSPVLNLSRDLKSLIKRFLLEGVGGGCWRCLD